MARLRKFSAYSMLKRPYTRISKYKGKSYVKTNTNIKIVRFDMGNLQKSFPVRIVLRSKHAGNVRQEAIESARQTANRLLEKKLGKINYYMKIKIFPHHVLREHAMATGAGADRMSSGMAHSFGKPMGKAARIRAGQEIMIIEVDKVNIAVAKLAAQRANCKLPFASLVEIGA